MAFHHLLLPGEITALLTRLLKPGGVLLVVDLMAHVNDESGRGEREEIFSLAYQDLVPHRYGFSREEIQAMFGEAGLEDFEFKTAFHGFKPIIRKLEAAHASARRGDATEMRDVSFFLARGSKPTVRRPILEDRYM